MFICLCKHHEWCKHQRSRKCSGHRGSSHCIWAAEIANCLSRLLSHAAGRLPPPVWSSCHLLLIRTLLFFPIASTFSLQTECKFMTSLWYECIKILLLKKRLNKKDFLKKKKWISHQDSMAFSLPYWFRGFMPFSFPPAVFWLSYFHSTGGHLAKFCKLRARTKQKKTYANAGKVMRPIW